MLQSSHALHTEQAMQAQAAELTPTQFSDSLALRAKQLRFRGVGNQFSFLDGVGIVPIQEFLYRGANIIDLAEALNIPITVIHRWIEFRNYQGEIDAASQVSAEGYIYQGEKLLKEAENKFQLDKAKAMLEHGRFMASKKDKKQYGNTTGPELPAAGVTYIFNVGDTTQAKELIEGEYKVESKAKSTEESTTPALVTMELDFNIPQALTTPAEVASLKTGIKVAEEPTLTADAGQADQSRPAEQDRWSF